MKEAYKKEFGPNGPKAKYPKARAALGVPSSERDQFINRVIAEEHEKISGNTSGNTENDALTMLETGLKMVTDAAKMLRKTRKNVGSNSRKDMGATGDLGATGPTGDMYGNENPGDIYRTQNPNYYSKNGMRISNSIGPPNIRNNLRVPNGNINSIRNNNKSRRNNKSRENGNLNGAPNTPRGYGSPPLRF